MTVANSIARLQRRLTIGVGVTVLLAFVALVEQGEHGWAAILVAIVGLGHAAVLAVEFAWMHAVNRRDASPRATLRQLLRAWIGEVLVAPQVFCWRQPFFSRRCPDHWPARPEGRTGVLLVHGFFCNRGLWNPWLQRLRALDVPSVAIDLEPAFGSIDDYAPLIEAAVRRLESATGRPPILVGHSMGGLAIRRWWAGQDDARRVRRILTIGTPHHGTVTARLSPARNAFQMRVGNPWLGQLLAREHADREAFICFFSHCDNIVFPASNARLPGADNRHLPAVAHVDMCEHPATWDELMRQLSQPPEAQAG